VVSSFYFLYPSLSLLLLLPVGLWLFVRWRMVRQAQVYCSPQLMSWMRLTSDRWRDLPWRWLGIWMLLVLSLCQPRWENAELMAASHPVQWVAVVDMSDSMQAQDVQPNRLQQARWLLESLSSQWVDGDRVGLVAYSAREHWVMPLTSDRALWQTQLSLLEPNLLPLRGSRLQATLDKLDASLPADVGLLILTDGGGIDATSQQSLRHASLMVLIGSDRAQLPVSVADGAGLDVGVARAQVTQWARARHIQLTDSAQPLANIQGWLADLRQHSPVKAQQDGTQDADLRLVLLLLALGVWLSFWRVSHAILPSVLFLMIGVMVSPAPAWADTGYREVLQQAQTAQDAKDDKTASHLFQQAFRLAMTDDEQAHALQGLAVSLQAQSDWFATAQSWRGLLAYQPDNQQAKAQLTRALSHLPKPMIFSGEGNNRRPAAGREGVIDDWPDMPEQEETKDVLSEAQTKNALSLDEQSEFPASVAPKAVNKVVLSQLSQQQQQARIDTAFLGEERNLGAQQRSFYQRLFEQEAGFAAAQSEPQTVDGVSPW
jgi:hypothetical protein